MGASAPVLYKYLYFPRRYEMSSTRSLSFDTSRTFRFTAIQACEINNAARLLNITQSELVRTLLEKGVEEIKEQVYNR